ncbi:MAG: hypothetical protein ABEI86_13770 [Halobacteriaceae archaeon]
MSGFDRHTRTEFFDESAISPSIMEWEILKTWRNTLPPYTSRNSVELFALEFEGDVLGQYTNQLTETQVGTSRIQQSATGAGFHLQNSSRSHDTAIFTINETLPVPHFTVQLNVNDWVLNREQSDDPMTLMVMLQQNPTDGIAIVVDIYDQIIACRQTATDTSETLGEIAMDPPFELISMVMGNALHVFTRKAYPEKIEYIGEFTWTSPNLYKLPELSELNIGIGGSLNPGESLTVGKIRKLLTAQIGIRDPTLVTYANGRPYIKNKWIYFLATCGGKTVGQSYQGVFRLHKYTYQIEFIGVLFSQSEPGFAHSDHAAQAMVDTAEDKWYVFFSGWGKANNGSDAGTRCYVGTSQEPPLNGAWILDTEPMHLPAPDGRRIDVYDPFVIKDPEADRWQCIHNSDGINEISLSETENSDFTSGWQRISSKYQYIKTIEGGKITKIGTDLVSTYATEGAKTNFVTAGYPEISEDIEAIEVDPPTGDNAPHPMICPVPYGDKTVFLLLTMDGASASGFPREASHGALWIYQAKQGQDGYPWSLHQ